MWHVAALRLLAGIVCLVPREPVYAFARLVGILLAVLPTRRRAALRSNISVVHAAPVDDPRVRRDVRRSFQHAMLNYVDLLRLGRRDAVEMVRRISVADWQPLSEAMAAGRGCILVSAHLGNFDTIVQLLPLRGYKVYIPVEPINPPELLEYFRAQRAALGITIAPVGPDSFRHMTACLRDQGIVVIVSDRDIQGSGQDVQFFGHTVRLPAAAILLGLRTGAPVLGAFGHRHADSRITGRFSALPQPVQQGGDEKVSGPRPRALRADLARGMGALAAMLEEEIRRDPGQWVVQQPIFATDIPPSRWSVRGMRDSLRSRVAPHGSMAALLRERDTSSSSGTTRRGVSDVAEVCSR